MRRLVIPIAALIALLAIPAGASAYTLGVSDQQAQTFTNPLFAPLKFKAARYITPYDVMESPADKAAVGRLVHRRDAPRARRSSISFEHSHRSNSRALKAPTVAAYTKELKKFKKAYPDVREISPWNEVNRCHARDRRQRPGPADQDLQPDHGSQAHRAVLHGRPQGLPGLEVHDRRPRHPRRAERQQDDQVPASRSCATRRRTRRSSASTTTRTRTASRRPAPSACCRPSAARCG